ncbi:unnamed protein product, partial [Iphiclides podalirius]
MTSEAPVDYASVPAVGILRDYLRIRSVHPNVDYDECLNFLKRQAAEIGLPVQVFEVVPKKPVLVMSWEGLQPELPSVLLNSHMDVVPVFEKSWKHPPFEAELVDGTLYGRGVQDMKSVAIQYLEAVKRLKNKGIRLKRTLHLSFVPDEEVGGAKGMGEFVKTEHFKRLKVDFALDEGIACATDEYQVYNGERSIWHINVVCPGKSGHGSLLLPDNCGVKGGIQENIVPEKITVSFDIRLALSENVEKFEETIKQWCKEAGAGVSYNFSQKDVYVPPTPVDASNPYWVAFKAAADKLGISLAARTFPGGTDSRYVRAAGAKALGFTPVNRTASALHEHDESLPVEQFLRGIEIYESILPAVANA